MAYIDTLLKAHQLVSSWYGGQEAQVELPQDQRASGGASGQRAWDVEQLEQLLPRFLGQVQQELGGRKAQPEGSWSARQWEAELSQAMEALAASSGGLQSPAAAARAAAAGTVSEASGARLADSWQAGPGGSDWRAGLQAQAAGQGATMEAISRFFERDARRYGG